MSFSERGVDVAMGGRKRPGWANRLSSVPRLLIVVLAIGAGAASSSHLIGGAAGTNGRPGAALAPRAALARLFTARQLQAGWFSPTFLAQASIAHLTRIVDGLKSGLGAYTRIDGPFADGHDRVDFFLGSVDARIDLDRAGRIQALLFTNIVVRYVSRSDALDALGRLPGKVSLVVESGGATLASIAPDKALAVSAAFKLAVLDALRGQVAQGRLAWDHQVVLRQADKSLPPSGLGSAPAGSRYSVAALARAMIADDDNTATDMLIRLMGRDAVAPFLPPADRPLLTTHDLYVLKDPARRSLRARWLAAAPAARAALVDEADRAALPSFSTLEKAYAKGSVAPGVEWFLSARQLCGLMDGVHDLTQTQVNHGAAAAQDWRSVSYEGGAETGVVSLTTWVVGPDGASYCVAAIWNHSAALDDARIESLYASLLHSYARLHGGG